MIFLVSGLAPTCFAQRFAYILHPERPEEAPKRLNNTVALSNLSIILCRAGHVCSFPGDGSRDPRSPHFGQQRGSFQAQLGSGPARSTDDPPGLFKRFHDQAAV